eukprot:4214187-Prymnesium_polylepis.1
MCFAGFTGILTWYFTCLADVSRVFHSVSQLYRAVNPCSRLVNPRSVWAAQRGLRGRPLGPSARLKRRH